MELRRMTEFASPAAVLLEVAGLLGLGLATLTDLRSRIIPNTLVLGVVVAGGAARIATDGALSWISLGIALAVFVPLALLAHRDMIGGGDAKMIAAATLLVEPPHVAPLLAAIVLSGGVLATGWLMATRLRKVTASAKPAAPGTGADAPGLAPLPGSTQSADHEQLPYGVAILAGVAITLIRLA
jgi:prepilin peptidase CpaA